MTSRAKDLSRPSYILGISLKTISFLWYLLITVPKACCLMPVRRFRLTLDFKIPELSHRLAVKLLVFLTLPADVSARNFREQRRSIYHTLEIMLEKREVFHILFSCLGGPLERLESSKLQLKEEDGKIIQLFLTFIRNCLISDEKHKQLADMKFTIYIKVCVRRYTMFAGPSPRPKHASRTDNINLPNGIKTSFKAGKDC
jgi:hypothetical protein